MAPSETQNGRAPGGIALLLKHQAASLVATGVDFGVMIAVHELLHLSPAWSTVVGATCGAISNFTLGRHWTFRSTADPGRGVSRRDPVYTQAWRYAIVSATSLLLNALGEHLLAERLHVQYVVARLGVALAVSVLWNFPLQRAFVFAQRTRRHGES